MPISEIRIKHFKAYSDTGLLKIGPLTPIVGKNDVGKSAILHALKLFFDPPKKGGIDINDLHCKDDSCKTSIEVAFNPDLLQNPEVKIDAKNKVHIVNDNLVDVNGLLRIRANFSIKSVESFEILIKDVDFKEYYPLALKKHDDLLALLKDAGLQAVKAGKETNQEKRNRLREYALSKRATFKEEWVDATSIEKPVRDILPNFIFFTDTAKYSINETSVQNQFKGIVDRALSENPNAQKIENDIKNTIQGEFDKLFKRLMRLTDNVTSLEAEPRVSWKKAVDGISLSWGDSLGINLPYESRGAGIRRLFMVAYFQYEAAESIYDLSGSKYVFVIEEPEVHLHPGAQRDLEAALKELSKLGHSIIFTTHSPVFASSAPIDDLVLVTRENIIAETKQTPKVNIIDVANELGVEASDRLIGKNYIILVEGPRDVECYEVILKEMYQGGLTSLDPDKILFLQCGGVSNLKFSVTTKCMDEAGLEWAVIVDSDKQTEFGAYGRETQFLIDNCPSTCSSLISLKRTAIENYLDARIIKKITGIDCIIPQYGKPTDGNGQILGKRKLTKIKNDGENIFRDMGFNGIISNSIDGNGKSEWVNIFEKIRTNFNL